jgi:hypothetical protein
MSMKTLTKAEQAELMKLNRKIMSGKKVTRKEVLRAIDLKRSWPANEREDRADDRQ